MEGLAARSLGQLSFTMLMLAIASGLALDATTFMTMSAVMLVVAVLASCIPAHRASSVDSIQALRID